jgi:hypothetical protein
MQRHGTGLVVLAASEAEFILRLTGHHVSRVTSAAELDACLQKTRTQWLERSRIDREIVLAMIADMVREARELTCN